MNECGRGIKKLNDIINLQ